jgi:hypothetical protein
MELTQYMSGFFSIIAAVLLGSFAMVLQWLMFCSAIKTV